MPRSFRILCFAAALLVIPAKSQTPPFPSSATAHPTSSAEMQRIFDEDQAARQMPLTKAQGMALYKADAARRITVQKLLDAGKLHTGQDFEKAAFIFQHGDTADDYLLAHTLASLAVANGRASAVWIMTATLDRYLQKIGQPQIYGTQYLPKPDGQWTQEPYNRALISDTLRKSLDVPPLAAQEEQLKRYQSQPEPK